MTTLAEQSPASDQTAPARFSATSWLIGAFLVLGAVLRIARWVHFRSLWLDEIYLASNIVNRSLHDLLFRPLDNWQAAPAGFLLLEHFALHLFGPDERSLRLIPLLFGLASLPLLFAVSRRLLTPRDSLIALAAFSVLGPLVYYSNEVKPYSCDVAVSLAVTLVVLRFDENRTTRRATEAAIIGAIAPFLSFPAIFILAGCGIWLLLRPGGRRKSLMVTAVWAAACAANFALFLFPFVHEESHTNLVQFWLANNAFMPHAAVDAIYWIFSSLDAVAQSPGAMWLEYPNAALVGLLVGSAVAFRRRGRLLLALAPLPFVFLAAFTREYPFADRLAIFFVPQYLLLFAGGVEALWTNLPAKAGAVALAGLVIIPSGQRALGYLFDPHGREESLPAYRFVAGNWHNGDCLYLSHYAELSFDYYQHDAGWNPDPRNTDSVHTQPTQMRPDQIVTDVNRFAGRPRVWVVLIHPETEPCDVQGFTVAAFERAGHKVLEFHDYGVIVCLYDCTHPISALAPLAPHLPIGRLDITGESPSVAQVRPEHSLAQAGT
jgi:hypothetical protein